MNDRLRKFATILLALGLSAVAPLSTATGSSGGSGKFSLNVSPLGTTPVAVTIRNESSSSSTELESFKIYPPAGATVTLANPAASASATVKLYNGVVKVNKFTDLKGGSGSPKSLTIYLNVTYGGGAACGSSYKWTASAWGDDDWDDDEFSQVYPAGTTDTQSVTCKYSLTGLPASVPAGASATATATLKNESPAGAPAITSLTLTPPAGMTVTSANPVTGLNVAPGATANVTVTVGAPCNATGGNWGSSASGASGAFTWQGVPPYPATAVGGACSIVFNPGLPNSVVNGQPVVPAVGVTARSGDGNPVAWNGAVTWTLNGSGGSVSGGSPVAGAAGTYTFPGLTIASSGAGPFTLTAATTLGSTSTSVTSAQFRTFQAGDLGCGEVLDPTFTNPGGGTFGTPGYAAAARAGNKDGSTCVDINYTFTNTAATNNSVQVTWDAATQPNAAFDYTVFWRPEFVDPSTGLPKRRVKVAWETDGLGNPIYVWGNACLGKDPPAVYTTLANPLTDTSGTSMIVNVPSGALLAVPFAVVVGTERMTVTSTGGGTNWTVVRGGGNGTSASTHAAGDKVMTTPLPIDPNATKPGGGPNPYLNQQARMCIWDESFQAWTPNGANLYDCSPTSPGYNATSPVACILRKTSVFDFGDGFMSLD